jgi:hypothetical protein
MSPPPLKSERLDNMTKLKLKSTYYSNQFHIKYSDLPQGAADALKYAKVEVESTRNQRHKYDAVVQANLILNGKSYLAKINYGPTDLKWSGLKYSEKYSSYVDQQGKPIQDESAHIMATAERLQSEMSLRDMEVDLYVLNVSEERKAA